MTYARAMQFWFGRINYEVKSPRSCDLSLDCMRLLLALLGNPQDRFRIVHVAGSKGKGSTSAMLASILFQDGYRVGLFTSPHLVAVEERMQVNGQPITHEELTQLLADIQARIPAELNRTLTFFEIATAVGFLHFARRRVDVALIEVGLGGRFDSTNVCRPLLSVITSISLDHTQILGNTLAKIAMEKAGIVKPGRPCVSGVRDPRAREVIERICRDRGAPLEQVDVAYTFRHDPAQIGADVDRPARVTITTASRTWPALTVGLMGAHQAANAALAVAAVDALRRQGLPISNRALADGLAKVHWPARLEIMERRPLVLLDCAHNVASAQALVGTLRESLPARSSGQRILLFAGSNDKDLAGMLAVLVPHFDEVALTCFKSPRSVPPEELAKLLPPGRRADLFPSSAQAWEKVRRQAAPEDFICVTGSVFLAGELRPLMENSHRLR